MKNDEGGVYDDPRKKTLYAHEKNDQLIMEVNETDASKTDKVYNAAVVTQPNEDALGTEGQDG